MEGTPESSKMVFDVYVYNAPIERPYVKAFINCINVKSNCAVLLLTTYGGSPDEAYWLAKSLQDTYESFELWVVDKCKSAGSLVALGAHSIAMGPIGELGPLDLQLPRTPEVGKNNSVLDVANALSTIRQQTYIAFDQYLASLVGAKLETETAGKLASSMAVGLFSELVKQLDPISIGEVDRSISIAVKYAEKLNAKFANLKPFALKALLTGYPSHGFVVDANDVVGLFHRVRMLDQADISFLLSHEGLMVYDPLFQNGQMYICKLERQFEKVQHITEKHDKVVSINK
ncbi:MAG: hypothetical protein IT292_07220 [Deltaproteobacteria bacterium]|nr:hypothetical protein [Deltaproteobacteria bacterium]